MSLAGLTRRQLLASAAAVAAGRLVAGCATAGGAGAATDAPAPRLGPAAPTHCRFELGDFEVTTVSDAGALIDGPWPIVGEDRPQSEVEALMRERLLPPAKFQPGFTPTVVNTGRELVLFDTGNGASGFVPRPDGGWLAAQLAPAGIPPERIGVVVLTHAHIDHIGGMIERGRLLFPNARVVVGETEHRFWSDDARLAAARDSLEYRTAALFRANVLPLARRTALVNPGDEVVPGIRAVEAHGHTPGHLAFHVESAGRQLLVWGDCAHHEVASLAHPEWHALFDMDKDASARTRRRMYELAAAERLPVVGYHTSFPSVGFVERDGRAYRWLPATYQLRV